LREFFDSSVLIPAFYAFHIHHAPSAKAFLRATKESSFCALRTIGEVYSVLTGLPVRPRITGRDGFAIVEQVINRLTLISLNEDEYLSALRGISATVVGGAAYDALIAHCAIKCQADVLLTWNVRDFARFGPDIARLIKMPTEI
jgi:predicted nucleic acid-binding protein